jgi:hypothetical protein
MAVSKLTCPECSTVLRPAKPVPVGKKVKCPRCETVFAAAEEETEIIEDAEEVEEEEERPARRPARKGPARAKAPARAKPKAAREAPAPSAPKADEDEGTYSFFKDGSEEEDEDTKPKIDYAPDMTIKDLRGPAVAILMPPSNKLTLVGFAGVLGWLAFFILILIPAVFPVSDDTPYDVMQLSPIWSGGGGGGMGMMGGGGGGGESEKSKIEDEKPGMYDIVGFDLAVICDEQWYIFSLWLIPIIVCICYTGVVTMGAIKMQNLESWGWGLASCIMAMVPITTAGLMLVTFMVINVAMSQIFDDYSFIYLVATIAIALEWLGSVAIAIWAMKTLFNEEVQAGFEYVGE